MTSSLEQLVLNGLALNATTKLSLEEMVYTPPAKQPLWAGNPDADGEALVQPSHYTNSTFELTIRVVPAANTDAGLAILGELQDALQACENAEGGAVLEWTPAESARTYTYYVQTAEVNELPIAVAGDAAGWFVKSPVAKVKLTAGFGHTVERTLKAATESGATPLQILYGKEVAGDVLAIARLILTDKATQNRRYAEVGWDVVSAEGGDLELTAADLTTTGFSGEAKTRTGAFSEEKVKRATATAEWTPMAGTGVIPHVGSYRVQGRFYTASEDIWVRISYRSGDGSLTILEARQPTVVNNFCQVDLGEIFIEEKVLGTQKGEIRVETKSVGATAEVDLNYLLFYPTGAGYGRARGRVLNDDPVLASAADQFEQTEGAVTGKTATIGGVWAAVAGSDAVDLTVIAANDVLRRTEANDADLEASGRLVYLPPELTDTVVQTDFRASDTNPATGYIGQGVLARVDATPHWLMALVEPKISEVPHEGMSKISVVMKAGTTPTIARAWVPRLVSGTWYTLRLFVSALGNYQVFLEAAGTPLTTPIISGYNIELETGKTVPKGKCGIIDAKTLGGATVTREYRRFSAWVPTVQAVCYSAKAAELRSDGFTRQDAAGTYYGPPSQYRGANFYLAPAGDNADINRIAVGMRRNDVAAEADSAVTDKVSSEVKVIERFLTPR